MNSNRVKEYMDITNRLGVSCVLAAIVLHILSGIVLDWIR